MTQIINENLNNISNLEIDGVLFIVEDISYTNTLPKRNLNRFKIINGTEIAIKGDYVPLEFEIKTTISVPVNRPDYYSAAFTELQSKVCDIFSPLMGHFKAELTINYEPSTPESIKVRIHILEVPGESSNIPGENTFVVPEDKLESEADKKAREEKNKTEESSNKKKISDFTKSKEVRENLMATAKAWNKTTKFKKAGV